MSLPSRPSLEAMAPTTEPSLTLDMYAMRDMCTPAVPADAPSTRQVRKSLLRIRRSIPLFSTPHASTGTRIVSERSMENILNRVDGMSVAPGQRMRSTLARGPMALERAILANEARAARGVDRNNADEPASSNVPTNEPTAHNDDLPANGRELPPVNEAEVSDSEHSAESDGDEDNDDNKDDDHDGDDGDHDDNDNSSVVEVAPPKADKGKGRASDEASDEASEHSDSDNSEFSDDESDSCSTTDSDNDSVYAPQNSSTRVLRRTSARTTNQPNVASSSGPRAARTRKGKKTAANAPATQVNNDLSTRIEPIWNRIIERGGPDWRGKGDQNPVHKDRMPDPEWENVEWPEFIQKMTQGYTPCPIADCPYAFSVKRKAVTEHFIKHHFHDTQFASKQYVLSWLALSAEARKEEVSTKTRFPCIFEKCSRAHGADGYGRHLCEAHSWEGLVNFRCNECDVAFWARDGGVQSLLNSHLLNCEHYNKFGSSTAMPTKRSKKRKTSSDAEDDAEEGPSTRRKKRKTSSDAEDDVEEGPSTRRKKRSRQ